MRYHRSHQAVGALLAATLPLMHSCADAGYDNMPEASSVAADDVGIDRPDPVRNADPGQAPGSTPPPASTPPPEAPTVTVRDAGVHGGREGEGTAGPGQVPGSTPEGDEADASRRSCAAALGLYESDDCETLAEGIMGFNPQFPLWSDGISKDRYVYLPPGQTIDVSDPDAWVFPVGTKFWKHFATPEGARLETRVIEKTANLRGTEGWSFETYVWNAAGNDVVPVTAGLRDVLGTAHDIPAVDDCSECHSGGANRRDASLGQDELLDVALGFGAIQLNHDGGAETTLEALMADGRLSEVIPLTSAVIPGDATARAALGYLHGNCGSCHGGAAPAKDLSMFIAVDTATVEATGTFQGTVNRRTDPNWRATGLQGMPRVRVVPGDADNSALVWRMMRRGDDDAQMPPLATDIVDRAAVAKISDWINSL